MAWWCLSRAQERWARGDHTVALRKAKELMASADPREQKLILARLQDKGMTDEKIEPADRRKSAQRTIDELLVLHDDDQEAWFVRAQLADGPGMIPYYKALLMLNPLHPGANHELVHYYENIRRPALGWPYAEKYIESSPGIPHPFHMQAHLATRIGRWDKTSDRSARAIELQRHYHQFQNVKPSEDWQFSHHLEILTISLVHDGRFQEARKIKAEAQKAGYSHWLPWFRLHMSERDWKEVNSVISHHRKHDKALAAYMAALAYVRQGDVTRAAAEVDVMRQMAEQRRRDRKLEERFWEAQGLLQCKQGAADEGLKLLQRCVDKTKNDFRHHAWGNGAYYMEVWGDAALETGRLAVAEEAYLESLAHDPGSARAALGMEALCRKQGRLSEADRFASIAKKVWKKADLDAFVRLKDDYSRMIPAQPQSITTGQHESPP
jgi:tetratricopeptide (TPR) repeat protein